LASTYIHLPVAIVNVDNFPVSVEISNDVGNPVPVSGTIDLGTVKNTYDEVSGVANGVPTVVCSYTALAGEVLQRIEASGTNIASFEVQINGLTQAKKYTYLGGGLSADFAFLAGIPLVASDVIEVVVLHNRSSFGDFSANIIVGV